MYEDSQLPDDEFHSHVFVYLDATCCEGCGHEPDLLWAWENVPEGERVDEVYAARAVAYLQGEGWNMVESSLLCPKCAAKRSPKT